MPSTHDKFRRIVLEPFVVPNRDTAREERRRTKTFTDSFPQIRIPQPPKSANSLPDLGFKQTKKDSKLR